MDATDTTRGIVTPDSLERKAATGHVMPGWTPATWAAELRRKAAACQIDHPDTAKAYQTWAGKIEKGHPAPDAGPVPAAILRDRLVRDDPPPLPTEIVRY